jgi:hypothetical protein
VKWRKEREIPYVSGHDIHSHRREKRVARRKGLQLELHMQHSAVVIVTEERVKETGRGM